MTDSCFVLPDGVEGAAQKNQLGRATNDTFLGFPKVSPEAATSPKDKAVSTPSHSPTTTVWGGCQPKPSSRSGFGG